MDYTVNIRAVVASFYVDTVGLDVGLINSVQGIKGGKNWEVTFSRHSRRVCKAILKVVEQSISDALQEELDLTFAETWHRRINISFDMGWQKKGT